MLLIRLLSALPLSLLYAIGSFFAFITHRIVGYRKSVIISNLKYAFPEKSDAEIKLILKGFYRQFFELIVEIIHSLRYEREDWLKTIEVANIETFNKILDKGTPIILLNGHVANWEWPGFAASHLVPYPFEFVYQKVGNKSAEKYLLDIRTKDGAKAIQRNNVRAEILERKDIPRWIAFLADQSPRITSSKKWVEFLGKETAFYTGPEVLAKEFNYAVVFADVYRMKRGKYHIEVKVIAEPPYDDKVDYEITQKYAQLLSETIRRNPSDYLWSHRRWKYTKEEAEAFEKENRS